MDRNEALVAAGILAVACFFTWTLSKDWRRNPSAIFANVPSWWLWSPPAWWGWIRAVPTFVVVVWLFGGGWIYASFEADAADRGDIPLGLRLLVVAILAMFFIALGVVFFNRPRFIVQPAFRSQRGILGREAGNRTERRKERETPRRR
jgi:hypothetical protein